jgi:alpha-1,3-rhamnosyl/mannosyltransferase
VRPRIGLNLLWLLPEEAGGAESYATRLLRSLDAEARGTIDVTLLVNRRFGPAHPDLASTFPTAVAPVNGSSRPARILAEATWLAREAVRRRLHLVHHLNNVVPLVRTRPNLLTIHDLRPLELPDTLGAGHGVYLRSRIGPSAARARAVTAPTGFVRDTVIDRLRVPPERVVVVSAALFPRPHEPAPAGVDDPFFVYPAITNPHKNHRTLLEAFRGVVAAHADARLVLTGAPGLVEDEVAADIDRLGLVGSVLRLGRIAEARLDGLVREAAALVYPSRYEGFGLPLAEAMAAGCPVIAADATALPEVLGGAGVLAGPDDPDAWSEAMLRILDDGAFRDERIRAGRERAAAFTPRETARGQVAAYRLALRIA